MQRCSAAPHTTGQDGTRTYAARTALDSAGRQETNPANGTHYSLNCAVGWWRVAGWLIAAGTLSDDELVLAYDLVTFRGVARDLVEQHIDCCYRDGVLVG